MFKLVVLSVLLAVAAARPSDVDSTVVIAAEPATVAVQEHGLAKVGSVVKSIPTAVSHQSQSIVHSSAHVVEDVVAPVVRTHVAAAAAPVVHTAFAPAVRTVAAAAPLVHTTYAAAAHAPVYASPLTYAAVAPIHAPVASIAASSPLTYTATGVW